MIRRNVGPCIQIALSDSPVVLLSGARQTGKTTLVQSLAHERGYSYYTLDDASISASAASDPKGFIESFTGPVVIDEVQKAPELFPAIKVAVDQSRQPGRFLLTGSANVMVLPRLSESLAGRMEVIPLYPFSAGELAGLKEGLIDRLFNGQLFGEEALVNRLPGSEGEARANGSGTKETEERQPANNALDPPFAIEMNIEARLARGGYPVALQRRSANRRSAWFASYISTLLQRDVRDILMVEALHTLPRLLESLAARTSGLVSYADIGRDAGLPHTTTTRYLSLFEALFLVHRLPAWHVNLGKRLVKSPKLHLLDTGLACHLLGADEERLKTDRPLLGRLLETFVVGEIRKQVSYSEMPITLYHLRTSAGAEVDLILERSDGAVAALEVKASSGAGASDFSALKTLRDQLGHRFRIGLVLYLGDTIVPFGERLFLAPISCIWH